LEEQDKERAAAVLIQNYYRRYKQVCQVRVKDNFDLYCRLPYFMQGFISVFVVTVVEIISRMFI
jgi:hypothetical protein